MRFSITLILYIFLCVNCLAGNLIGSGSTQGGGFPSGYTKYQEVTIDSDLVSATETNFPVYLDLSDFDSTTDVFDTCRSDGGDIRVTLSDGTTQLAREVVFIDTGAKTGELHVNIPSLSSSIDTVIRVWYNGTDTEPEADSTYGSENTWNSNYELVCHMNDLTTSTVKDSTSHGRDGTKAGANTPSEAVGQIGESQDFDPSTEYISFPATVITQTEFSTQFWEYSNGTTNIGYFLSDSTDPTNLFLRRSEVDAGNYGWGVGDTIGDNWAIARQQWNKCTITQDSSGNTNWLVNGNTSSDTIETNNFTGLSSALYIGNRQDLGRSLDGVVDEIRVLSVELDHDWDLTEYNNQSSPSTFYSVGSE